RAARLGARGSRARKPELRRRRDHRRHRRPGPALHAPSGALESLHDAESASLHLLGVDSAGRRRARDVRRPRGAHGAETDRTLRARAARSARPLISSACTRFTGRIASWPFAPRRRMPHRAGPALDGAPWYAPCSVETAEDTKSMLKNIAKIVAFAAV